VELLGQVSQYPGKKFMELSLEKYKEKDLVFSHTFQGSLEIVSARNWH
jgi:hypothetical protein